MTGTALENLTDSFQASKEPPQVIHKFANHTPTADAQTFSYFDVS